MRATHFVKMLMTHIKKRLQHVVRGREKRREQVEEGKKEKLRKR